MSQSGYTPIALYSSGTASATPTAGNLVSGELAINYADGKLFYKDSSGVVQTLASKAGNVNVSSFSAGSTGLTPSTATTGAVTLAGTLNVSSGGTGLTTLTAGYIPYGNGTSAFSSSANLTWNGSTLQVNTVSTNGLSVQAGPVYLNGYSSASYISGQASLSSGGTFTAQNSGSGTIGMLGSGDMSFYTNSGLTVGNTFSPTERMRIDSSGNLGIGTSSPNASAILDAQSTTKGVRMPNMTTTQKNAISSPAAGLIVFDTTLAKLCVYSGSAWQTITSV